mgnify:CR=1 FL=1
MNETHIGHKVTTQNGTNEATVANAALSKVGFFARPALKAVTLNDPSAIVGTIHEHDAWFVKGGGIGDWSGFANQYARSDGAGGWVPADQFPEFVTPVEGDTFWIEEFRCRGSYFGKSGVHYWLTPDRPAAFAAGNPDSVAFPIGVSPAGNVVWRKGVLVGALPNGTTANVVHNIPDLQFPTADNTVFRCSLLAVSATLAACTLAGVVAQVTATDVVVTAPAGSNVYAGRVTIDFERIGGV